MTTLAVAACAAGAASKTAVARSAAARRILCIGGSDRVGGRLSSSVYRRHRAGESVLFGTSQIRHEVVRRRSVVAAYVEQPLRRQDREGVLDDPLQLVPIHAVVEPHAEPASVADVRRTKEP